MNPGKHAAPTAAAARAHEEAPSVPEEGFRDAAGSADDRRSDLKAHGDVPGAFRLHARPEDGKTAPAVSARKRLVHIQRESEQLELPAYRNGCPATTSTTVSPVDTLPVAPPTVRHHRSGALSEIQNPESQ